MPQAGREEGCGDCTTERGFIVRLMRAMQLAKRPRPGRCRGDVSRVRVGSGGGAHMERSLYSVPSRLADTEMSYPSR